MSQLDTHLMHPTEQIKVIIGRIYRDGMTTTSGGNISIKDTDGNITGGTVTKTDNSTTAITVTTA